MTFDFRLLVSEIQNRIYKIQQFLKTYKIDTLCVQQHADLNYLFRTSQNDLHFIPIEKINGEIK